MKKILIALPLVLIMILSMIPVFAEEPVPEKKDEEMMSSLEVYYAVYKDYKTFTNTKTHTHEKSMVFDKIKLEDIKTADKAQAVGIAKLQEALKGEYKAEEYDFLAMPGKTAVEGKEQEAGKAYVAIVGLKQAEKDTKATEKVCPKLCDKITVKAHDIVAGKDIAVKVYGVNEKVNPNYLNIVKHFINNYLNPSEYQILSNWAGQPSVDLPSVIDSDCTITIKVLPRFVRVNVVHKLYNCCKEIDGRVNFTLWKSFVEENQVVDFIAYHTQLMVDQAKAAEFAMTRLQKINAMDFVFVDAVFDDGIRLDQYMTGKIYDMDGNEIGELKNADFPTITLSYHRAECVEKEEEKVDNATVENNNNTTPVTANGGANLPATGAKDVSAFFLSAVALLGLGIFFAKKH